LRWLRLPKEHLFDNLLQTVYLAAALCLANALQVHHCDLVGIYVVDDVSLRGLILTVLND